MLVCGVTVVLSIALWLSVADRTVTSAHPQSGLEPTVAIPHGPEAIADPKSPESTRIRSDSEERDGPTTHDAGGSGTGTRNQFNSPDRTEQRRHEADFDEKFRRLHSGDYWTGHEFGSAPAERVPGDMQ